ncbi:MAG: bifunctional diguanylate cyclase/phosphodiesterase [Gammaproteobacteria bacterium]|nr:bifunctional diguanylate cyclase/phosphodiesterase [Gammaproteobacteria bacterium]NND38575.1 bifunctional diguanylate cyclase/phosphodiesterase [Pseudomonadales bacterium]MBT8151107.1 bifunctional diguanylate cyclase/phosphodiesterase [Gammaproteobacteria bacterium]NNL11617.1 bifunctional diguanylate cyclase/phosphodiesterase [Pseudomonadales bacterium]NNM10465.1 bifunctional diguanylate cyclase/phosphodiesterase [Pseudomonadales bacterium]
MSAPDHKNQTVTNRVYISITAAVLLSIALILSGIWNAEQTGQVAENNINASVKIRQLSDAFNLHQQSMSAAIDFAVTSGDASWRNNYENHLLDLNQVMLSAAATVDENIIAAMREKAKAVVETERELFRLIGEDQQVAAFELLASDSYQERKIEQEEQALTLRATLELRSRQIIENLSSRLRQTTFALIMQIVLIVMIWFYIVTVVKRWQLAQTEHRDELSKLAHYDPLTGIGNRALFQLRLESAFQQSKRDNKAVGLLLTDIDHFKDVNDNLGHDIGDKLLVAVAEKIKAACRESDTVIRLGGDEFAIIITNLDSKRDSGLLANKILSIFERDLNIHGHKISTGTSIGLAFYPDDAENGEELLRKADMALYEAKRAGRRNFKFFDAAIEASARNKVEMQKGLISALENKEFKLFYQPLINMSTGEVIGAESLIRWFHPETGMVPPDDFISVAEESRLIIPIGAWVLEEACRQQVAWEKRGMPPLSVAVNLSGVQFGESNLVDVVEKIMRKTGISKNLLTLEITESTLMEDVNAVVARLHALNALGLKLAIDDFGTGYSSLAYLKRFPIHHLKIDREFVNELPHNSHDIAIARSIIKMAHELGVSVVAEGIENQEQLDFLSESQCNYGQGYYFGKPMPADEFEQWYDAVTQPQPEAGNM